MIKRELPKERFNDFTKVLPEVEKIINEVRTKGDKALIELEEKFNKIKLNSIKLQKIEEFASQINSDLKQAIDVIYSQLYEFNSLIKPPNIIGGGSNGIEYGVIWKSIERVGIYVASGDKIYPLMLLMAGVPAVVAGVNEIYVATPPNKITPVIAYIGLKLNVKEIYTVSGAQAIAALAYGTETVKKVDKIVGFGDAYVQAAKYLVSKDVEIDGIEGPTELVIIADEAANPHHIVLDLKAQAEIDDRAFLVLFSNSDKILDVVSKELEKDANTYYLIKVNDIDEAIKLANELMPRRLSLYVANARIYLSRIKNAGVIVLGDTPPAMIDYSVGPNNILSTHKWPKIRSGISVYEYLTMVAYVSSVNPDKKIIDAIKILAKYEGFDYYVKSIGARYNY